MTLLSKMTTSGPFLCLFTKKKYFFEAIPRDLNTKNGYISNFYEKLGNDFIVQNDNFRTIFILVHEKKTIFLKPSLKT